MRHSLKIWVFIFFHSLCNGQERIVYLKKITHEDGLSQTDNAFLHVDQSGFLWIGSLDGANRYDGKTAEVFKPGPIDSLSVKGEVVQSNFFEDKGGNVWFTTTEAINCYNKKEGSFYNDSADGKGLTGHHYAFHLENGQFLWATYKRKLYRYDVTSGDTLRSSPIVEDFDTGRCAVSTDSSGHVDLVYNAFWSFKPGFETIQFSEDYEVESRKTWFDRVGNPADFTVMAYQVFSGEDGIGWLFTDRGLLYFGPDAPEDYRFFSHPDKNLSIKSFSPVGDRYFLVLLSSSELALFDKKEFGFLPNTIRLYDLETKLPIQHIGQVFSPVDSVIWLSATGAGVYFGNLKDNGFVSLFTHLGKKQNAIYGIYEASNDNVLCVSESGKSWLFGQDKKLIDTLELPVRYKQIVGKDGQTWFISPYEFGRSSSDSVHTQTPPIDNAYVFNDLIELNDQYLVLGTNEGIVFYDKVDHKFHPPGQDSYTVKLFLDGSGRLWEANASTQLNIWNVDTASEPPELSLAKTFDNFGLINAMLEDLDRALVWIGTSKGLIKVDPITFDMDTLSEANGLSNQFIHSAELDAGGNIWLSTNKGITRYAPETAGAKRFRFYTSRDGLSGDEYRTSASLVSSAGYFWYGSTKGVDVFRPEVSEKNIGKAPKLVLKNIKVHGQPWHLPSGKKEFNNKLAFSHNENTLTFELAALEFTDPKRNQIKAKLAYQDKVDSILLSAENKITYANLSPGKYQFSYTGCNSEGIWQKWQIMEFIIEPPFYKTWWFIGIVVLILIALAVVLSTGYYRYQLKEKELELEKRKRKAEMEKSALEKRLFMEKERSRIAGEMHDEMGGGLSTIRNATARAINTESPDELRRILVRVSQISVELIDNMHGIIWAMDPGSDTLDDLCAYIRRYTKEYLEDNNIKSKLNIPFSLPQHTMPGKSRHNIMLAVKEALHNIVKHASATSVAFEINFENRITILIQDNGTGFNKTEKERTGHGLRNIERRMKNVGGKASWHPVEPRGTLVELNIPLKEDKL